MTKNEWRHTRIPHAPARRRIGIGTKNGYATFSSDPFNEEFVSDSQPADILEIFFTSSLVRPRGAARSLPLCRWRMSVPETRRTRRSAY